MSMDENIQYAVRDQLERVADSMEALDTSIERIADMMESLTIPQTVVVGVDLPQEAPPPSAQQHLSLFLVFNKNLPTWLYNDLRRKMIPAQLAARLLGMPQTTFKNCLIWA